MPQINDIMYAILCNTQITDPETRKFISKNEGLRHQFIATRNKNGRPILYFDRDRAYKNRKKRLDRLNHLNKFKTKSKDQEELISRLYKEIKEYPRSLSYYIARQNTRSRDVIDNLNSDSQKMKYILHAEIYYSITSLYRTLHKILKDLYYFLENTNPEEMRDLTFAEKQDFHDAKLSIDNTLSECEKIMRDMKNLDAYLNDAENY